MIKFLFKLIVSLVFALCFVYLIPFICHFLLTSIIIIPVPFIWFLLMFWGSVFIVLLIGNVIENSLKEYDNEKSTH